MALEADAIFLPFGLFGVGCHLCKERGTRTGRCATRRRPCFGGYESGGDGGRAFEEYMALEGRGSSLYREVLRGIAWFQKLDTENAEQDVDSTRTHEAEVIFEHAYDSYKQLHDAEKNTSAPEAIKKHVSRPGTFNSFLDDVCMVGVAAPARPTTVASERERFRTAFDAYGGGAGGSPLVWWKEHEPEYPIVAKMARDFLAIPGTSVSVERLFSKSRHLCHESRGSLHAKTIMEAMLTKMWIKAGLLKPGLLDCGRG